MWNLFHKKKEKAKMDFSGYEIKLTIKAICMFERLSGKSFFKFNVDEDIPMLLYSTFYTSNNVELRFEAFMYMLENEEISKWAVEKYKDLLEVIEQFKKKEEEIEDGDASSEAKDMNMTDMATSLIVDYHVDAHYVMYEMELWEIQPYFNAADIQRKNDLITQRFWTYLTIAPNINTKKVKSPEELVPFDWEEKKEDRIKKQLEKDTAAAVAFLRGNNRKQNTEDGKQ